MAGPDKAAGAAADKSSGAARGRPTPGVRRETSAPTGEGRARHEIDRRPERYMVAVAPTTELRAFATELGRDPQIRVVRTIGRTDAAVGYPHIVVIETTAERAAALARVPGLHAEPDPSLGWGPLPTAGLDDGAVAPVGEVQPIVVAVDDDGARPVEGAA